MNVRSFSLAPFPGEEHGPDIRITGTIGRRASALSIRCALLGNLSEVALPEPAESAGRRDRLWEESCLEIFLAAKGSERYWEFNLSPSGHWNAYRFTSYRMQMREEPAFLSLPLRVRATPQGLRLSLELDIGKVVPAGEVVDAAVAAVIKTPSGGTSHWALVHPGPRPDFHRRDGFALTFPAR